MRYYSNIIDSAAMSISCYKLATCFTGSLRIIALTIGTQSAPQTI